MWNISTVLGSMINGARCTHEIASRMAMAKAAFNRQHSFHQKNELKFKEETSEVATFGA